MPTLNAQKLFKLFERYKYLLLVVLVGVILLVWPSRSDDKKTETAAADEYPAFSAEDMQTQLEGILSRIEGAGSVNVFLTLRSDMEMLFKEDVKTSQDQNERKTVLVSDSGSQQPIVTKRIYPEYQGALIVCEGGGNAALSLKIVEAVSSLTGLGGDKITVLKMGK